MGGKRRVVFDTNVIVSALLLADSTPQQALLAVGEDVELLLSEDVVAELDEVLSRDAFDRYIEPTARRRFLRSLVDCARLIPIVEPVQACRDPRDDKFLELAMNGNADVIVSGDRDLLDMHAFRNATILTPKQFLDWLAATPDD